MRTIQSRISLIAVLAFVFTSSVQGQERRRWSPQAKGTAIGVGVGGAAGAIINKRNRVVGGLIGGAAGGAAGYGIGKGIDNRRKTNARIAAVEREAAQNRREAAEARREAQLARQEAAAAADRPAVVTRPAAARVAAVRKSPVPAVAAAGAGFGAALAATAYSAQTVSAPYGGNGNALFLTNASYGDPASAYPTSEVRRKSW